MKHFDQAEKLVEVGFQRGENTGENCQRWIQLNNADKGLVTLTQVLTNIYQCDILNVEFTPKKKNVVHN